MSKEKYVPDATAIRAIEESIKHWKKDILEPLERGKSPGRHGPNECALCRIYPNQYIPEPCSPCPIFLYYGYRCGDSNSAWQHYDENHTADNARAMIAELEAILPEPKPDGKIVEAARGYGLNAFAQTIQSEIDSLRNLFRNHEKRLKTLGAGAPYISHDPERLREATNRTNDIMDRLSALEKTVSAKQPQATDKNGAPHLLRPRKSILLNSGNGLLYRYISGPGNDAVLRVLREEKSQALSVHACDMTWVGDLPD